MEILVICFIWTFYWIDIAEVYIDLIWEFSIENSADSIIVMGMLLFHNILCLHVLVTHNFGSCMASQF